mmetsp:Transcript_127829/g.409392  ORF Transcript_127829/g.409392 Transcript_127829/m.409392 type:complete len:352 (+) Transcript_127829:1076-2131(+)
MSRSGCERAKFSTTRFFSSNIFSSLSSASNARALPMVPAGGAAFGCAFGAARAGGGCGGCIAFGGGGDGGAQPPRVPLLAPARRASSSSRAVPGGPLLVGPEDLAAARLPVLPPLKRLANMSVGDCSAAPPRRGGGSKVIVEALGGGSKLIEASKSCSRRSSCPARARISDFISSASLPSPSSTSSAGDGAGGLGAPRPVAAAAFAPAPGPGPRRGGGAGRRPVAPLEDDASAEPTSSSSSSSSASSSPACLQPPAIMSLRWSLSSVFFARIPCISCIRLRERVPILEASSASGVRGKPRPALSSSAASTCRAARACRTSAQAKTAAKRSISTCFKLPSSWSSLRNQHVVN